VGQSLIRPDYQTVDSMNANWLFAIYANALKIIIIIIIIVLLLLLLVVVVMVRTDN